MSVSYSKITPNFKNKSLQVFFLKSSSFLLLLDNYFMSLQTKLTCLNVKIPSLSEVSQVTKMEVKHVRYVFKTS